MSGAGQGAPDGGEEETLVSVFLYCRVIPPTGEKPLGIEADLRREDDDNTGFVEVRDYGDDELAVAFTGLAATAINALLDAMLTGEGDPADVAAALGRHYGEVTEDVIDMAFEMADAFKDHEFVGRTSEE